MNKDKPVIGYRVHIRESTEYFHLHLELKLGYLMDASTELGTHVGTQHEDYYRDRLLEVKEHSGGSPVYFSTPYSRAEFALRWQANKPTDEDNRSVYEWYAPTVEDLNFRDDSLEFLQRVMRALKRLFKKREGNPEVPQRFDDIRPIDVIQALGTKAWNIQYGKGLDMWHLLSDQPEHLDRAPQPQEA